MKSGLRLVVVLAGALMAVLSVVGVSSAGAVTCVNIGGSGSSLQAVAQTSVWSPVWLINECATKPTVTYNSTSSGNGKKQWGSGGAKLLEFLPDEATFPAFVGSDPGASIPQMENMSRVGGQASTKGILTVPVLQSAITQMISLPEGCTPSGTAPEVSGTQLAEEWEKDSVPFLSLVKVSGTCTTLPGLLVRSSNSGTTAGQKRYFATRTDTAEWLSVTSSLTRAEEPVWPTPVSSKIVACCEKGSQLVLSVYDSPGTIGYADLADSASAMGVVWSKHTVGSKSFWSGLAKVEANTEKASPEETGGGSNCKKAKYVGETNSVSPGEDWSVAKQKNVNEVGAYPVCTLTFDLAWHKYETTALEPLYGGTSTTAEETANTVRDYLHWIVSGIADGGQELALLKSMHYGPLPKVIKEAAETGVNKTNIE